MVSTTYMAVIERKEIQKRRLGRMALAVAWIAFLYSYVIRFMWAAMMPEVEQALGVGAAQSSYIMSVFYVGYVGMQVPAGILTDRVDEEILLAASMGLSGLLTLANSKMPTLGVGLVWRFFAGLSAGLVYPSSIRLISRLFHNENSTTAMGIFMTSVSAGMIVCNSLIPLALLSVGWRESLAIAGIAGIVGSAAPLLFRMVHRSEHNTLCRRNNVHDDQCAKQETENGRPLPLPRMTIDGSTLAFWLTGCFGMWATTGSIPWLFSYLREARGLPISSAGVILTIFSCVSVLGGPMAGMLSRTVFHSQKRTIAVGLICYAGALIGLSVTRSPAALWSLLAILGFFVFFGDAPRNAMLADIVAEGSGGRMIGLSNAIWQAGLILSPWVVGKVVAFSGGRYDYVLISLAVAAMVGAISASFISERRCASWP